MRTFHISKCRYRIKNSIIDIDISTKSRLNGNKWFEIRVCGLGIDINYNKDRGWSKYPFTMNFKIWLRNRKDNMLYRIKCIKEYIK